MVGLPPAAGTHYSLNTHEMASRHRPEQDKDFGIREFDVPLKKRKANACFFRRGLTVGGRAPVNDIGNVNLAAVQSDGSQHSVQKLTCAPDERQPLPVLFSARRFADEHDPTGRIAVGEHGIGGTAFQLTALECHESGFQFGETAARCGYRCRVFRTGIDWRLRFGRGFLGRRRYGSLLRRRNWCKQTVDRNVTNRLVGTAINQPTQGGNRFFSGQTGHRVMVYPNLHKIRSGR